MKDCKRFLISMAIVICGYIIVDVIVGKVGNSLLAHTPNTMSESARANYSLFKVQSDVIIIGASRANHHYNPAILEDSLKMSVYNTGRDGHDFVYNSCILNGILKRYIPKLVIFDATEAWIDGHVKNNTSSLRPYYCNVDYIHSSIIETCKAGTQIAMYCNMYRFNSILPNITKSYFSASDSLCGYIPLIPNHQTSLTIPSISNDNIIIDSVELKHITDIIKWSAKYGFKLIVVDSPRFEINVNNYSIIRPICEQNGITCIDNSILPYFMDHPELFNDIGHLNKNGADIYTFYFIEQIKPYISDIQ